MNAVGIDVSKGTSMVAVMRPFGEVVLAPFEISHTDKDLTNLAKKLKSLPGETRVVMEATGSYHVPVAWMLYSAGLYVSVVNAVLVHDYGNNSLRRAKTDKKDAVKLANYALDRWLSLPKFAPEEENRQLLKTCYRQYQQYSKVHTTLNNNLISLLDTVFPSVNRLFKSPARTDGTVKWVDFVDSFWHKECVSKLSLKAFNAKYQKWCGKHGYHFSEQKAVEVHTAARSSFCASSVFQSVSRVGQANALAGILVTGISSGHEDVRCRSHPRPPTHGGDRRCAAFPFQEGAGGLCRN